MDLAISEPAVEEESVGPSFECSICSRSYKRPEHLQRHQATHSLERPYRCSLCGSTFQRSDVRRRHARSCTGRQSKPSSTMKRACDPCSRSKRACNCSQPCNNCRTKSISCTYSASSREPIELDVALTSSTHIPALEYNNTGFELNIMDQDELLYAESLAALSSQGLYDYLGANLHDFMADELGWPKEILSSGQEAISLRFLESFTRNVGFNSSFDCGTNAQRSLARSTFASRLEVEQSLQHPALPQLGSISEIQSASYGRGSLALKSHEIVSLVKEVVQVKPRNSAVALSWTPVLERICMDFFSPQHLRLYIELYWAIWHPNVNFMHRPTFDPRKAKAVLVAAMCIIGACVSSDASDNENAKVWFSCVEEMVFRDDDFCYDDEREEDARTFPSDSRIQSVQAAYMVCLFQNWEGSNSGKRRTRRFRYSTLVAVS